MIAITTKKKKDLKLRCYNCKKDLLKFLQPCAIHKIVQTKEKNMKYYDQESEYFTFSDEKILRRGEFFDNELKRIVEFIVVKEVEKKEELFLYYNYGNFKFHIPTKK